MLTEAIKARQYKNLPRQDKEKELNKTLKGVLINNHIKSEKQDSVSFSEIENSLLIQPEDIKNNTPSNTGMSNKDSSFNVKKAIKPLLIGTGMVLGGIIGLSAILNKSSQKILTSKSYEQLPDLAVNMNIKQEPQFTIYRAIRDPNFKNILGAAAVITMSGITIAAKNFADGAKEIWLKKKSADIEKNLQENLISVETKSFSGKLKIVNDMLNNNIKFFDEILNKNTQKTKHSDIFQELINFKGACEGSSNNVKSQDKTETKKNVKYALMTAAGVAAAILLGKLSISNIKQTAKYTDKLANNIAETTINAINEKAKNPSESDIPYIINYLKSICAKPQYIKEIGEKYKLSQEKINSIIEEVDSARKTIFADAPTALGGIPKKIQYYCYIDEERGHLYNWILNPKNKFTKYIFLAFTLSGAIGYLFKQAMDAIKEVTVMRENAKTELNLRKRLVEVEIQNFKAKKESAINPLLNNFKIQAQSGTKSPEELKQLADNILFETKNGPPYVYT